VYILDPMLEEDQQAALVARFQGLVEAQGGEVQNIDRWERRRLAYEVKGRREGFYVVMHLCGAPGVETELSRVLGITEGVIRHLIVKLDDRRAERTVAEARAATEAKARAEAEARAAAEAAAAEAAAAEAEAAAAEAAAAAPEENTEQESDEGKGVTESEE
jgi:small subunit ribosomal protein S6